MAELTQSGASVHAAIIGNAWPSACPLEGVIVRRGGGGGQGLPV